MDRKNKFFDTEDGVGLDYEAIRKELKKKVPEINWNNSNVIMTIIGSVSEEAFFRGLRIGYKDL